MKNILLALVGLLPDVACGQFLWFPDEPYTEILGISVSGTMVEILGSVEPNGLKTNWWFSVSKDSSNCCLLPSAELNGTDSIYDASVILRYLDANSIYFANICAQNDSGKYCSYFQAFYTGQASKDESRKGLMLFPNPASSTVTAMTLKEDGGTFGLYNAAGERINEVLKDNCSLTLNISELASGMYFINYISAEGINLTKKFYKN